MYCSRWTRNCKWKHNSYYRLVNVDIVIVLIKYYFVDLNYMPIDESWTRVFFGNNLGKLARKWHMFSSHLVYFQHFKQCAKLISLYQIIFFNMKSNIRKRFYILFIAVTTARNDESHRY